jgi:hypothetical protein
MRLYTGAGLSTLDLITDLYMIYMYATTGQQGTALSLAIMVGLCISMQLLFCWMNTRKGSKRVMVREFLIVLSGLAPGVHAMRVANGTEQNQSAFVNPEMELVIARSMEMVFESCPGSVLQTYSLMKSLRSDKFSSAALASIIVSALTTGFGAAVMSFGKLRLYLLPVPSSLTLLAQSRL